MGNDQAIDLIKEAHKDQCIEIHGREYIFTKTVHKKRRKIYAFLTKISEPLQAGDHSFFDWQDFESIESIISDMTLFDDMQLAKCPAHWDTYPQDYILFIITAIQVISYPLWQGIR